MNSRLNDTPDSRPSSGCCSFRVAFLYSVLLNLLMLESRGKFLGPMETFQSKPIARDLSNRASYTAPTPPKIATVTAQSPPKTNHSDVVYGFVHIAKTAGTEINGELAVRYERVCGNKGYSYDAHAFNDRSDAWIQEHPRKPLQEGGGYLDSITLATKRGNNRGRVPQSIMDEIGYQDCDWVGNEVKVQFWQDLADQIHPTPLELHVPCREPVDLLLSMCNYQGRQFNCTHAESDLKGAVERCLLKMDRFNQKLWRWSKDPSTSISLKCFNPIPVDPYVSFMGSFLQSRRSQRSYVHRRTNRPRKKEKECLLQDPALQDKVKQHMVKEITVFRFCDGCLGSPDDLFASQSSPVEPK